MIHRYVEKQKQKVFSKERLLSIVKEPIVTEKSTLKSADGQYFLKVAKDANKIEIAYAVEMLFSVNVESVNTLYLKGKKKKFKGRIGWRSGYKKAMVRLKSGQTLSFEGGIS